MAWRVYRGQKGPLPAAAIIALFAYVAQLLPPTSEIWVLGDAWKKCTAKGHGFDLASTHLDDVNRTSRLVLAVCLTFVWFIALDSGVVKRGYRHFIDRKDRRDKSYFRIGWDRLEDCLRLGRPLRLHFKAYH